MKERPGESLLVVYTGEGKGKTTAALGLAIRALGQGLRVGVMQFIKGKWQTGERRYFEALPDLEFRVMGRGFTWDSDDLSEDAKAARGAWEHCLAWMQAGDLDVVILDELTYGVNYGFLTIDEVVAGLKARAAGVDVVVTGRNAPAPLVELADLVTDMQVVKHPFQAGHRARIGVDY